MAAEGDTVDTLLMTRAEYARHRDVSKTAVTKWIDNGRIKVDDDGKIDVAEADLELGETQERVVEPRGDNDGASPQLTRARAAGAIYAARLAQLKYEREIGNVVSVATVAEAGASIGDLASRIFFGIADRAEEIFAHVDNVKSLELFLRNVIARDCLKRFSEEANKLAAEAMRDHGAASDDDADANNGAPMLFEAAE